MNLRTKLNDVISPKIFLHIALGTCVTHMLIFVKMAGLLGDSITHLIARGADLCSSNIFLKSLICLVFLVVPAILWRRDARAGPLCGGLGSDAADQFYAYSPPER